MWIRKLLDVENLEPGKWTVRHAMPVNRLNILFVAVAAESEDGVPDRGVGNIFPVERPIPVPGRTLSYTSLQLNALYEYVREVS